MRHALLITFALITTAAQAESMGVWATPTYESVGLYWADPPFGYTAIGCQVRCQTKSPVGTGDAGVPMFAPKVNSLS